MYELLGAVVGAVLGLLGPFLYAQIYAVRAPDPTAAGALFVFVFITVPAGSQLVRFGDLASAAIGANLEI